MDLQSRFILLKKTKYSESDLILQALSPQGERVSFIARGALASRRRFGGGVLEPGHFVLITYRQRGDGNLCLMKEAVLINDFAGIKKDYDRLEFILRVLEAVGKVCQEGDSTSEFLFNLLGHTLKAADQVMSHQLSLETLQFQFWLKFLLQQGVLTAEPWMVPFLKARIGEGVELESLTNEARPRLAGLELLVEQYIKSATVEHRERL